MTVEETAREIGLALSLQEMGITNAEKKAKVMVRSRGGSRPKKVGTRFEYRCWGVLEKAGYHVKRSYSSGGPYDLLAIRKNRLTLQPRVLFIQCKFGEGARLSKKEIDALLDVIDITGGYPVSAICKKKRAPIWWHDIRDEKWTEFVL